MVEPYLVEAEYVEVYRVHGPLGDLVISVGLHNPDYVCIEKYFNEDRRVEGRYHDMSRKS